MNQEARRAVSVEDAADAFIRLERDAVAMSKALGVSIRTLYRIISRDDFHAALDQRGCQGERRFRNTQRKQAGERAPRGDERKRKPEYQKAKRLWEQMADIPEHRRAKIIANREDIKSSYGTVRRWCRDWRQKK